MTVSAGLNSILPLISFYSALVVFGFLSWFHFFKPTLGAILLTASIAVMYFTWPFFLLIDYFEGDYQPAVIEYGAPLLLSIVTISLVWSSRQKYEISKFIKLGLAVPPLLMAIYAGAYFTIKAF